MPTVDIVLYPNAGLRKVSAPVDTMDNTISKLIDAMIYTMYNANGIGLAAPQIDVHQRIMVVDVSESRSEPLVFINPIIIQHKDKIEWKEGCLSLPNVHETIKRAAEIKVEAMNRDGEIFTLEADELLSVCIQHEIDHLDGILFIDHLSGIKRRRALKELEFPAYPYKHNS